MGIFDNQLTSPSRHETGFRDVLSRFGPPGGAVNFQHADKANIFPYSTLFGEVLPKCLIELSLGTGEIVHVVKSLMRQLLENDRLSLLASFRRQFAVLERDGTIRDRELMIRHTVLRHSGGNAILLYSLLYGLQLDVGLHWLQLTANTWNVDEGKIYIRSFDPIIDGRDVLDLFHVAESMLKDGLTTRGPDGRPLVFSDAEMVFRLCLPYAATNQR